MAVIKGDTRSLDYIIIGLLAVFQRVFGNFLFALNFR